jgi:cobalt-zinc-cadmium efflux system outer membrane protein
MKVLRGVMPGSSLLSLALIPSTATASPSLSLDDAVQQALSAHPRIQAATERWQAATARARARLTPADPELELEVEGMASALDLGSRGERSVGVTQRFAVPLAWHHALSAARQKAAAVRLESVDVARLDVALEAATAYLDVQLAERLLALGRGDLELAGDLARIAQRRHDVGDSSRLAALRAEVEVGRASLRVAQLQDAAAVARAELNAILNRPLDAQLWPSDSLVARQAAIDESALRARALKRRPEIAAAAHHRAAARRQERASSAALLPAIDVGLFRHDFDAPEAPATWRLDLAVEVPLWAATRQRSAIAATAAEARRSDHLVEETRRRIALDVHTAVVRLASARRTLGFLQGGLLREAETAYTTARRSWDQGRAQPVDVLDARRTLAEVRTDHARAVHAHEVARHALVRAVGAPLDSAGGMDR